MINAGEGFIRQFVAMPLGSGYTVEAQVTGKEERGGIQIVVYEAKPGRFPDQPPEVPPGILRVASAPMSFGALEGVMGLGAGGKMRQKIYPDPHGLDTWDAGNTGNLTVHIVNSLMVREITGKAPPPTPISAETYTQYGLPWFDLYDEQMGDIAAPDALKRVKSAAELDREKGLPPQREDGSISVPDEQVKKYDVGPEGLNDPDKP
jgi:hypothetical protein